MGVPSVTKGPPKVYDTGPVHGPVCLGRDVHFIFSPNVVGYRCVAFNREVTLEKKGQLPPVVKVDSEVSSSMLQLREASYWAAGQRDVTFVIHCSIVADYA